MLRYQVFIILSLIVISANAAKTIDLFIWSGQSNAQGWQGDAEYYPENDIELDNDETKNRTM